MAENINISHLSSDDNIDVSILQFLSTQSSPSIEISKIKAAENVSIVVDSFFHKSEDYLDILDRISAMEIERDATLEPDDANTKAIRAQLSDLQAMKEKFEIDVLTLADIFLQIKTSSERLDKARKLFEEAKFSEASNLLSKEELFSDQHNLHIALWFWEFMKNSLLNQLMNGNPN